MSAFVFHTVRAMRAVSAGCEENEIPVRALSISPVPSFLVKSRDSMRTERAASVCAAASTSISVSLFVKLKNIYL